MEDEPEVCRVWLPFDDAPGLAMARAFGDFCLKEYGVISVPEFTHRILTDRDQFIVLASDGVRNFNFISTVYLIVQFCFFYFRNFNFINIIYMRKVIEKKTLFGSTTLCKSLMLGLKHLSSFGLCRYGMF